MEMGCIGFLLGALTSIVFVGIGIGIGRSDKEQPDRDSDIRIYHPSHDRSHRSMDRYPDEKIAHIIGMAEQLNVKIDTKEGRSNGRTIQEDGEVLSDRL